MYYEPLTNAIFTMTSSPILSTQSVGLTQYPNN